MLAKSHPGGKTDRVYCTGKIDHATAYCNIIELANGQQVTGRNQPSIQLIQTILPLLPPGSGIGQSQCGLTPPQLAKDFQAHHILTFPDSCGHVHIQVP